MNDVAVKRENLYNSDHKATNDRYREGYERTFGRCENDLLYPEDVKNAAIDRRLRGERGASDAA